MSLAFWIAASALLAASPEAGAEPAFPPAIVEPYRPWRDPSLGATLERLREGSGGKTPTVKHFEEAWVRALFERGEPTVYTRASSADFAYIGMPIGGIGAGQLYLGGDGRLWHWDLFNTRRPTRGVNAYRDPPVRSSPLEQGFALEARVGDRSDVRFLDRRGFERIEFRGQYPIGRVSYRDPHCPIEVELEAFSPFVPLEVDRSSFPATVLSFTLRNRADRPARVALAGWLENAVASSGTAESRGRRRNRLEDLEGGRWLGASAEPLETAPALEKRPPILIDDFEGGSTAKWKVEGTAFGKPGDPLRRYFHQQPLGGFEGKHLADSFRNDGRPSATAGSSDAHRGRLVSPSFRIERRTIRFLIGGGRHPETSIRLVVDGKIARATSGENSETLRPRGWDVSDLEGRKARLEIVDESSGGWGHVLVDRIEQSDEPPVAAKRLQERPDYGTMGLALVGEAAGDFGRPEISDTGLLPPAAFVDGWPEEAAATAARPLAARLAGSLGRGLELAAGESKRVTFVLAWFFPRSGVHLRTDTTRWYAGRWRSAREVAAGVIGELGELSRLTRLWRDTWYDSTLPWWFLDRVFLNTSILATSTCYRFRDGRFYADEGVYCCAGTCTHVWGYVQATGRLFPSLERALREQVDFRPGIAFFPDSGAISYRGEVYSGPQTAVDGQAGVVLRAYREHLMSPDDRFLRRNWEAIKKAMYFLVERHDADRDGILTGPQHNTLDAAWYGKIAWLSLYYSAALRATERMALEVGDDHTAKELGEIAERGAESIGRELWNGEYFYHAGDPEHPDSPGVYTGCEYSQLLGQSWAWQVGVGRVVDREKTRAALRSLWRYNLTTDVGPFRKAFPNGRWYAMPGEGGLIACTFPRGGADALQKGNRHFAGYLNECQNGYEYGATSLMMWEGMVDYALAHTRLLHERYHASRRNPWNEIECGEHYARSMASYGLFTGVCGFELHGPRGSIAFSPRLTPERFRAAFTAPEGWGTFSQRRRAGLQEERLELRHGRLRLRSIAFDISPQRAAKGVAVTVSTASTGEAASRQTVPLQFRQRENRVEIALEREVTLQAGASLEVTITGD